MDDTEYYELFRNRSVSYDIVHDTIPLIFQKWTEMLGGETNVFLRELLKGKKLA